MNTAARLTFRTTETAVVDKPAEEPDHGVLSSRWTVWAAEACRHLDFVVWLFRAMSIRSVAIGTSSDD